MIEFEDVGFSYGRAAVLRDVTLTLEPGAFHFLVGASGAGKSTLLRLAHLDLFPETGRIRLFGRTIGRRDRDAIAALRRKVGLLPREGRFLDHLPLIDNVALPLRADGRAAKERSDDLRALLEWVDLGERADAFPGALSSGQRQRAALARAVILSPEVILADEPTGGLDHAAARRLMALLVELSRMGKTLLVATHDADLAGAAEGRVPTRVLRLADGRVGPAEALA